MQHFYNSVFNKISFRKCFFTCSVPSRIFQKKNFVNVMGADAFHRQAINNPDMDYVG